MTYKLPGPLMFGTLLLLSGCLAAGVPYSSDPNALLNESYQMMQQGRPLPAKKFIDEALEKFKMEGDELGMADAYHAYGNLYKDKKLGFQRYEESEESFRKALALYEKNGNHAGIVKSHFGIGNTYRNRDATKECNEYKASLQEYRNGLKFDPNLDKHIGLLNTRFKNTGEMISAFMKSIDCKTDN